MKLADNVFCCQCVLWLLCFVFSVSCGQRVLCSVCLVVTVFCGYCVLYSVCFTVSMSSGQCFLWSLCPMVSVSIAIIIIIMVIFKCYFSREHIALSLKKRCERRIRETNRLKALCMMENHT